MAKFWIDPGHGGTDPGAVGNGLHEANVVLTIAKYAKAALEQNYIGAVVGMTRTDNTTVDLAKRDDLADNWGADYFCSIHINAGGGTGFESFTYNGVNDSKTNRLQELLHAEVFKAIKGFKSDIRDRGKKKANFSVLRETNMPACLLEVLFIDSAADAALLKNEAFLKAVGHAIARALATMAGLAAKPQPVAAPQQPAAATGKLYKVQVGAFSKEDNAKALLKQLEGKGFKGFIKYE